MVADINFYFDPVCPFAWMTSKWVRRVQAQREYSVEWRFISLRQLNSHVDYDAQFPPEYEAGHTAGLRLLRVAARVRAEHGLEAVGAFYAACGAVVFDSDLFHETDTIHFKPGYENRRINVTLLFGRRQAQRFEK